MAKKTEEIKDLIVSEIEGLGLELVGLAFERENAKLFLRVYIDKRGGVSLDDCAAVSEVIDPLIEEKFPKLDYDYFEVSSPGLNYPLSTPADFKRYLGELVEVKLYQKKNNKKLFQGLLGKTDEQHLTLECEAETLVFSRQEIAIIKRTIVF